MPRIDLLLACPAARVEVCSPGECKGSNVLTSNVVTGFFFQNHSLVSEEHPSTGQPAHSFGLSFPATCVLRRGWMFVGVGGSCVRDKFLSSRM